MNIKFNPDYGKGLGRASDGVKDSANFVISLDDAKSIIDNSLSLEDIATNLGLDSTKYSDHGGAKLVLIKASEMKNIRYSSVDTLGSNEWWAPGMQTSGGQFEAVIERIENVTKNPNISIIKINK
jgi:hypothetical protein